jgi:hypothetical protein
VLRGAVELLGTQHNEVAGLILAPIAILWGGFVVWAAVTDPGGRFTAWYEANKDWKIGFWVVSGSGRQFRAWHGVLRAFFIAIGIVIFTVVL